MPKDGKSGIYAKDGKEPIAPKYLNRSANAQARANDGSKYGTPTKIKSVSLKFNSNPNFL